MKSNKESLIEIRKVVRETLKEGNGNVYLSKSDFGEIDLDNTFEDINIDIKPTKLIARLSTNDYLVGANGKLIERKENSEILPYIFGEFNSKNFLDLKKKIKSSKFTFIKLKTLYFFPSNRWDILTNDNVLIKLPQGNISKSLNLAYKIINNNNFKEKKIIDLRVKNNLIIK